MERFWHAFIPLFVALDGVGLLPLYWAMAQRLSPIQRRRAVTEAVVTAGVVAVGFLLVSRWVLEFLGLTVPDLMIAAGTILVVLSLRDLLLPDKAQKPSSDSPGVVPLGVPLLAGPAVLTTLLLVRDRDGWWVSLTALSVNLVVVWVILRSSSWLMKRLGREGAQAISKVFSLILTAFGVMLIRQGVGGVALP
jgi:multiple antibiotic resistance protein